MYRLTLFWTLKELLQSELERERLARIDAEKKLEGNTSFKFRLWNLVSNVCLEFQAN